MHPIILTILLTLTTLSYSDSAMAQTATPTPTATITPTGWELPTQPLQPYTYTLDVESPDIDLNAGQLWEMARVALTSYKVIGGDNNQVWVLLAVLLLVPVAGAIIYRLLVHPPDI